MGKQTKILKNEKNHLIKASICSHKIEKQAEMKMK